MKTCKGETKVLKIKDFEEKLLDFFDEALALDKKLSSLSNCNSNAVLSKNFETEISNAIKSLLIMKKIYENEYEIYCDKKKSIRMDQSSIQTQSES